MKPAPTRARKAAVARLPARARRPWTDDIQSPAERRERKRLAILDCAARFFVERGYHETTLDDIATALAVTKPTLYYYVDGKEDILADILGRALAAVGEMFDEARRQETGGRRRLRHFVRRYVEAMTRPYGRCLLTMRSTPLGADTRARLNAGFRRVDALVRELIAEGIDDGSIACRDVRMTAFALFGALNTVPFWFDDDGPLAPADAGDALFAVLETGLAPARRTASKEKRS